jgi:hypothetical protein
MNHINEQKMLALEGTLGRIDRRLTTSTVDNDESTRLATDLDALEQQLAKAENSLKPEEPAALTCPATGDLMSGFRLLDTDLAASSDGLWFGPGSMQRLLHGLSEGTGEQSLEQIIVKLEEEQSKARELSRIRQLRSLLNKAREKLAKGGSAVDSNLVEITREVETLKKQAAEIDGPPPSTGMPNITPHPGALVSLIREDEKPCYLYAHAGSKTWMGRSSKCHVQIKETKISRLHCVIISAGNNWYLADLDSRNGTYVNGQRITEPVRLSHGDSICLGRAATMEFSMISIAVNEENFYTLALRRLTGEATQEEREELDEMLDEKPELRAEFDLLQHGSQVARAALPLADAINAPAITRPEGASDRLQNKVTETFRIRREDLALPVPASDAHLSPTSGRALTTVRVTDEVEMEVDLTPGIHRGGIFVRRDQLTALLGKESAGELLAQAIEKAKA